MFTVTGAPETCIYDRYEGLAQMDVEPIGGVVPKDVGRDDMRTDLNENVRFDFDDVVTMYNLL